MMEKVPERNRESLLTDTKVEEALVEKRDGLSVK